jgi:uncharacterized damage-inducible protein DinB
MKKDELMEMLEHSRLFVGASLSGLKNERLETDRVNGVWTVRDIVAHLAAWEQEFWSEARLVARRARPKFDYSIDPSDDWKAWNAAQIAQRADRSAGEIFLELEKAQAGLIEFVRGLSERQLAHEAAYPWGGQGTLSWMLAMCAGHKVEHARKIREWRTSQRF